jgi:hypothetical protein
MVAILILARGDGGQADGVVPRAGEVGEGHGGPTRRSGSMEASNGSRSAQRGHAVSPVRTGEGEGGGPVGSGGTVSVGAVKRCSNCFKTV